MNVHVHWTIIATCLLFYTYAAYLVLKPYKLSMFFKMRMSVDKFWVELHLLNSKFRITPRMRYEP